MKVISFEQFIEALGDAVSLELYREVPFPNFGYARLVNLFHQFCLVGGLPDVVLQYASGKLIQELTPVYQQQLEEYFSAAMSQNYTESTRERTLQIYQDAFAFAGLRITYHGFSDPRFRSREVGETFRALEEQGLLYLIYPTTETSLPWKIDRTRHPRLQLPDTGLVCHFTGIQDVLRGSSDLSAVFNRQISLHVVAQELMIAGTNGQESSGVVHFWVRRKTQSTAQVDFVIEHTGWMIPVEVRGGEPGRLRSLHQFMDISPHPFAIRLYAGPLSVSECRTVSGKIYYLMNLPYFLAGKIREHLEGFVRFVEGR